MLYFEATPQNLIDGPAVEIGNNRHVQQNHISHLLHESLKENGHVNFDDPKYRAEVSDILAALVSSYVSYGQLKEEYFWENSIQTITDNLINLGLKEATEAHVIDRLNEYEHVNHIVFGYQCIRSLKRRVGAFTHIVEMIKGPQRVIFSGANSAKSDIAIADESIRMQNLFQEFCKKKTLEASRVKVFNETESTDTIANLDKCLGGEFLVRDEGAKEKQCIVLISSSFHLIRITKELVRILNDQKLGINKIVDRVFMVGAEGLSLELKTSDSIYVKNMMFDIFYSNLK